MSVRKPFTFTSTPESRTAHSILRGLGYKLGDTVYTANLDDDGSLRPDSDREVYVLRGETGHEGAVYVLASTLSPKVAELKVGDEVTVAAAAKTAAGGLVYFGDVETSARITYLSSYGQNADVRALTGPYAGKTQTVGLAYLTKGDEPLKVTAPAAEPTLAERFPVGRKVVVSAAPKTTDGGYVSPSFRGQVATVTGYITSYGENVTVQLAAGMTNHIGGAHLTLLPEGVELAKPVVREPLTFDAAYRKAVAFRGTPSSAKQVAKASKLAELLIEVSK